MMNQSHFHILDGHIHAFGKSLKSMDDAVAFDRQFGYETLNYLSCECMGDATQNALGIYLKLKYPGNYAFGGFTYRYHYDFREEMEKLWDIGFDGMKMVEDKPTLRKKIGMPFNDPRRDGFFAAMQERQIPLLAHVGDPATCWDRNLIEPWAYEAGYFYGDGSYVTKEQLCQEVEDVLTRHPRLKIILAHLFFLSDDPQRLDDLMTRHPNVCLDIVSGTEMYFNFAKDPDWWREFFLKYQDRIVFGTDNSNIYDETDICNARITCSMEERFLTCEGVINAWDKKTIGIHLPDEVCQKIFRDNFLRLAGDAPRPLDHVAASRYLKTRLDNRELALDAEENKVIRQVLELL